MAERDSSSEQDWLNQRQPADPPEERGEIPLGDDGNAADSSDSAQQENVQPADVDIEAEYVESEEIASIPPPRFNESDGSTLIFSFPLERPPETNLQFGEGKEAESTTPVETFFQESTGENAHFEEREQAGVDPSTREETETPEDGESFSFEPARIRQNAHTEASPVDFLNGPPPKPQEPRRSLSTASPFEVSSPEKVAGSAATVAGAFAGMDQPTSRPNQAATGQPSPEQVAPTSSPSHLKWVLLVSYASAVTLALLASIFLLGGRSHQLESLPDIPNQKPDELTYVPAHIKLPDGHTLHLGESRRFGNILVEPLEIEQSRAEFVHYSGDTFRKREPTQPLWKLKLRLTNLSPEQGIAPFDRELILRWVTNSKFKHDLSNNYIAEAGTKIRDAQELPLYRLPVSSDWDMVGQELGKVLSPGASYETYLTSSDEGLDQLPENLVWRFQFRKGYSKNGNGVTTIAEVAFKKSDVKQHSEASVVRR
ncbi:hypothetical protein SH668x_003193 [Planctomicrobium sp. SH668]|uniref:hypothetical protein n=1 Tax=Planctomicrobium sp. SH668 TaxID=3448126 RepID=UPI003F5C50EF